MFEEVTTMTVQRHFRKTQPRNNSKEKWMPQIAKQSSIEMEIMPSRTIALDHTAASSVMRGKEKPADVNATIEEDEDDKAAASEYAEESREDDEVNRAAKNNVVRTNSPRG